MREQIFSENDTSRTERGASDVNLVITLVVLTCLVSLVVSCNLWVKEKNLEKRGYRVEGDSSTYDDLIRRSPQRVKGRRLLEQKTP